MAQKAKNVDYQIKTSDNPRLWLEIHLTSLLDKDGSEIIDKDIKNIQENINKKPPINKELINKTVFNESIKNKKEPENVNNKELINKKDINTNSQNDNQSNDLKEKWELILSKLELPSTKMLLSQQVELQSINFNEVLIALSPNWENMIKSRKVVVESAVKTIWGANKTEFHQQKN